MADDPFDFAGCLERVRQHDQAAARQLVEHLYPLVNRIVRSHLPRRVAVEDLAQDIFLKMFTRLEQYQGHVPFPHWVSRIAVTTCIDQLRAQQRRPEFRWADLSETEAEVLSNVMTDERDARPGEALAARELVHKLLAQLKPDDQLVIAGWPPTVFTRWICVVFTSLTPPSRPSAVPATSSSSHASAPGVTFAEPFACSFTHTELLSFACHVGRIAPSAITAGFVFGSATFGFGLKKCVVICRPWLSNSAAIGVNST